MKNNILNIMAAIGLASISSQASAAACSSYEVNGYQAFEGTTVCFIYNPTNINELYGTPTIAGDTIYVTPTDFLAQSLNTQGAVQTVGTGTIQIAAKDGYSLDTVNFLEYGDYKMTADSTVDVSPWLKLFDANGFGGYSETISNVPVTGDLTLADGLNHDWSAEASFDLTTTAWDEINYVGLTLQNTLDAYSNIDGGTALIQKKGVGSIVVSTTVVPVPAAVWLFASGLIGLFGVARRKN